MKETSLCRRVARNLERRGQHIRSDISLMEKITLKVIIGLSRYNTIKRRFREEIVEWILSHPNVKP